MEIMLGEYLMVPQRATDAVRLGKRVGDDGENKTQNAMQLETFSFSFAASDATSIVRLSVESRTGKKRATRAMSIVEGENALINWIEPSPYHAPIAYDPVMDFIEEGLTAEASPLGEFISNFVEKDYMVRVESDVDLRLRLILEQTSCFTVQEVVEGVIASGGPAKAPLKSTSVSTSAPLHVNAASPVTEITKPRPLFRAAVEVVGLLRSLFIDLFRLPPRLCGEQLLAIIDSTVLLFFNKCRDKYKEGTLSSMSAERLADTKVCHTFIMDPLYFAFRNVSQISLFRLVGWLVGWLVAVLKLAFVRMSHSLRISPLIVSSLMKTKSTSRCTKRRFLA